MFVMSYVGFDSYILDLITHLYSFRESLVSGLLLHCDYLVSAGHPELTSRNQIDDCTIRQFFEKVPFGLAVISAKWIT